MDKTCTVCGKDFPRTKEFFYSKTGKCKKCYMFGVRSYSKNLRLQAVEKLGGVCCKCGFIDKRALQIDHVDSDGYIERKDRNHWNEEMVYRKIINNLGNYQLLCANCNVIKAHEKGELMKSKKYDYEL